MAEVARLKRADGDAKEALKWARAADREAPHSFEIARGLIALLIAERNIEGARDVVFEQKNRFPDKLHVLQVRGSAGRRAEAR
jgi:hypothetical protein